MLGMRAGAEEEGLDHEHVGFVELGLETVTNKKKSLPLQVRLESAPPQY